MRMLLVIALALLAPMSTFADPTPEKALASRWDSLRFALGVLESDHYMERPVIVLYKTAEGGVLMTYDVNKIVSRTRDHDQLKAIVVQITTFFAGAGSPPPSGTQLTAPAFHMKLSIDNGFARESFFKALDAKKDPELIGRYAKYISDLAGK